MTQNPGSIPRQRMEQKSRCWSVAGHPGETRLRDARKGNNRCLSHKGIIIPRVYVISVFLTSLFHSSKGKNRSKVWALVRHCCFVKSVFGFFFQRKTSTIFSRNQKRNCAFLGFQRCLIVPLAYLQIHLRFTGALFRVVTSIKRHGVVILMLKKIQKLPVLQIVEDPIHAAYNLCLRTITK